MNMPTTTMQFSANQYAAKAAQHPFVTFMRTVLATRFELFAGFTLFVALCQLAVSFVSILSVFVLSAMTAICIGIALRSDKLRSLALSMSIVPTVLFILFAAAPAGTFQQSLFVYSVMGALALAYRLLLGRPEPTLSALLDSNSYAAYLPGMMIIGTALGVAGYGLLGDQQVFAGTPMVQVLAALCMFAAAEELVFRGLIQRTAAQLLHPFMAALLSAISYAVIMGGSVSAFAYGLLAGLVLAFIYYQKQNLVLTTTTNIIAKLVFVGLLTLPILR